MPAVLFQHGRVNGGKALVVSTGADEVAWSYRLNVAKFVTYGGEVVQILSTFIDDVQIQGTLRSYKEAEAIYEYFMNFFVLASQGEHPSFGNKDHFEQEPMKMIYPERNWHFYIQPISAPGFIYSLETVAPKWQMKAHVVDRNFNQSLDELIATTANLQSEGFGSFTIKGLITPSPISANPSTNPFIAPLTPSSKNNKTGETIFEAKKQKEINEGTGKIADYYSKLLPTYMNGGLFETLTETIGSKPIFGRPTEPGNKDEFPEELIRSATGAGNPPPKTN